jgi:LAO/AO transport system kinase
VVTQVLTDRVLAARSGAVRAIARLLTAVENGGEPAAAVAEALAGAPRNAQIVGVTGAPGAGKSTLTAALLRVLRAADRRVAVLAVDPSSPFTGGALLGDRVRMADFATDPGVFIRSLSSRGHLGGLSAGTPAAVDLMSALGFDTVIVETVGVGQSETLVANMVDFFLVLTIAGAGDELQAIKKGVLELADMIAVNKADGDNERRARAAASEYQHALHLLQPASPDWNPPVLTCSALTHVGLDTVWAQIELHRRTLADTGEFQAKRRQQQVDWMWSTVEDRLRAALRADPEVRRLVPGLEDDVRAGRLTHTLAGQRVLDAFER